MLCVWYTFSSPTDQQDADKKRDRSRDVFTKHPQMVPNTLVCKEAYKQIHSVSVGELLLNAKTSENGFLKWSPKSVSYFKHSTLVTKYDVYAHIHLH